MEHRIQRITAIENKLEKYKKLLQEEEQILQVFENEYVQGMEGSMSDKETHRLIITLMFRGILNKKGMYMYICTVLHIGIYIYNITCTLW